MLSGQHVSTLHCVIFRPTGNTDPRTVFDNSWICICSGPEDDPVKGRNMLP